MARDKSQQVEKVDGGHTDLAATAPEALPVESSDPATRLILADLLTRGVARLTRKQLNKGVLRKGYSHEQAKELAKEHSVVTALALYGISKLATRSVPGALAVTGGLLAKTLYDRGKSRRAAREETAQDSDILAEEN